ncbi:unnamed protein product [Meganyctiphanes norvegica]|uniref:Transmembrane protein n=1 Tax=Meganyctiphanes norvegica TaxID=48144 RepID=A0AAV2SSJ8_MEGNR
MHYLPLAQVDTILMEAIYKLDIRRDQLVALFIIHSVNLQLLQYKMSYLTIHMVAISSQININKKSVKLFMATLIKNKFSVLYEYKIAAFFSQFKQRKKINSFYATCKKYTYFLV